MHARAWSAAFEGDRYQIRQMAETSQISPAFGTNEQCLVINEFYAEKATASKHTFGKKE